LNATAGLGSRPFRFQPVPDSPRKSNFRLLVIARPFVTGLSPRQRDILGFLGSLIRLRLADPRLEFFHHCFGLDSDGCVARLRRMLMREKTGFLQFSGKTGIEHFKFLNPFRAA
jgi:hypothetical protein